LERDSDGQLCVHLEHPLNGEQLAEVLARIERWLRLEGVPRTRVRIDEETYQVIAS
jgi:hypothetical protein